MHDLSRDINDRDRPISGKDCSEHLETSLAILGNVIFLSARKGSENLTSTRSRLEQEGKFVILFNTTF